MYGFGERHFCDMYINVALCYLNLDTEYRLLLLDADGKSMEISSTNTSLMTMGRLSDVGSQPRRNRGHLYSIPRVTKYMGRSERLRRLYWGQRDYDRIRREIRTHRVIYYST